MDTITFFWVKLSSTLTQRAYHRHNDLHASSTYKHMLIIIPHYIGSCDHVRSRADGLCASVEKQVIQLIFTTGSQVQTLSLASPKWQVTIGRIRYHNNVEARKDGFSRSSLRILAQSLNVSPRIASPAEEKRAAETVHCETLWLLS